MKLIKLITMKTKFIELMVNTFSFFTGVSEHKKEVIKNNINKIIFINVLGLITFVMLFLGGATIFVFTLYMLGDSECPGDFLGALGPTGTIISILLVFPGFLLIEVIQRETKKIFKP